MERYAHRHPTHDQPTTINRYEQQPSRSFTRGSMWRLETPNRLVIEFGEERPGERPKMATRVYVKMPQP